MSTKKTQEEWISSKEAAEILTAKCEPGHTISRDYVRVLGKTGKIETKKFGERVNMYLRADVDAYQVKKRGDGSIRVAAGHKPKAPKATKSA